MSSAARANPPSSQMRLVPTVPVVVVSANPLLRQELARRLGSAHWEVSEAESGADALLKLESAEGELLLLDPTLPDLEPSEFHALVNAQFPHIHVVTVNPQTGQPLLRSSSPSALALQAVEELERTGALQAFGVQPARNEAFDTGSGLPGMIGSSEAMQRVYSLTRLVARRNTTVVILGESGTGKDLVAQAIHLVSPR